MRWYEGISFPKDPSDVLDYPFDFTPFLQGDTIDTATVTGTSVTVDSSSVASNVVTAWLSGGSAGVSGKVVFKIVTTNSTPRTIERTIIIDVRDR